jgi:manganese-transporting P-type ATPase
MSTVSTLPGGCGLVAIKGAPETLKLCWLMFPLITMKSTIGIRVVVAVWASIFNQYRWSHLIKKLSRDEVESNLKLAGFLIFYPLLKQDAVDALNMLADSSHCVRYRDGYHTVYREETLM